MDPISSLPLLNPIRLSHYLSDQYNKPFIKRHMNSYYSSIFIIESLAFFIIKYKVKSLV